MKKFIIGKRDEKDNLEINVLIELFYKRFKCAKVYDHSNVSLMIRFKTISRVRFSIFCLAFCAFSLIS